MLKTLDVICYICTHPQFEKIEILVNGKAEGSLTPISAIHYFASIDASWHDDFKWKITTPEPFPNDSYGKDTLIISR